MFKSILKILGISREKHPQVKVLGIYEVKGKSYCVIELLIKDSKGWFDVNQFTQEWPTVPRDKWPKPYQCKFLNPDGTEIISDYLPDKTTDDFIWIGDIRICFFFHFPAYELPLITPWGNVSLPNVTQKPKRLAMFRYKQSD